MGICLQKTKSSEKQQPEPVQNPPSAPELDTSNTLGHIGCLAKVTQKVTFRGKHREVHQQGFEDKKLEVTGEELDLEFLHSLNIGFTCKKGLKSDIPNQDDFCVIVNGPSVILGVFDGHGPHGHKVSDYVCKNLPQTLLSRPDWETSPLEAMKESYPICQKQLLDLSSQTKLDCVVSGSTATLIYAKDRKLWVSHVGDSRAIIGRREADRVVAYKLTNDHKPQVPQENERILKSGGLVKKLPYDVPYRVFFENSDMPGLSMSRCFGDSMAASVGVICEPDTFEYELTEEDEILVVGSDGVWEFIQNQEAINLVAKCKNPKQAAEKLSALAWTRWIQHEEDIVDDITVVVAYILK